MSHCTRYKTGIVNYNNDGTQTEEVVEVYTQSVNTMLDVMKNLNDFEIIENRDRFKLIINNDEMLSIKTHAASFDFENEFCVFEVYEMSDKSTYAGLVNLLGKRCDTELSEYSATGELLSTNTKQMEIIKFLPKFYDASENGRKVLSYYVILKNY